MRLGAPVPEGPSVERTSDKSDLCPQCSRSVLFGKWSGTEVKIDGQELLIMKESDIMGIIDEPVSKKKAA